MTYFQVFEEIIAIKPGRGSEYIMIPEKDIGTQDDAFKKPSGDMIPTNQSRVACNGGGGTLGHPQIFLTLGSDGRVMCPYCSREFVKSAG